MTATQMVLFSLLAASPSEGGTLAQEALKFVPGAQVLQESPREVKVRTPKGTVVEVEFTRTGQLEEASGDSVENDVFIPRQGLLSLEQARESMKKLGKTPVGDWSLEKSFAIGWHFEFEGFENGNTMDYVVDAKTGKLLNTQIDD